MRRTHMTKIVATLGPSSSSEDKIRALFEAGVDVFGNFSHGSQDDHRQSIAAIRMIEQETKRPIAIMMDLQGPKLRVGDFSEGAVLLEPGQPFRFDMDSAPGDADRVSLPHKEIFAALEPGSDLLVNDGKIRLKVIDCGKDFADAEVVIGGEISNHKGVNVPGVVLPLSSLTDKDRKDMQFGLDHGVDWVALSFIQRPEDLAEARRLIGGRAPVLTKLEKPAAIDRLDEIIELSDAVMVARRSWRRDATRRCARAAAPEYAGLPADRNRLLSQHRCSIDDRSPQPTRAEARTWPPQSTARMRSCYLPRRRPGNTPSIGEMIIVRAC